MDNFIKESETAKQKLDELLKLEDKLSRAILESSDSLQEKLDEAKDTEDVYLLFKENYYEQEMCPLSEDLRDLDYAHDNVTAYAYLVGAIKAANESLTDGSKALTSLAKYCREIKKQRTSDLQKARESIEIMNEVLNVIDELKKRINSRYEKHQMLIVEGEEDK